MKSKDKEFHEKIFELYGKVIKGNIEATNEFKEIFFKYFPNHEYMTKGQYTKQEYLHVMYNWLCRTKI